MYATADDMRARFTEAKLVQLTDAASWDATAIAAIDVKLADASAIVDGYVAKYYAPAPEVGIPPILRMITCDIAFAELQAAPTDDAKDRRDRAYAQLRDISKGLIKLDGGEVEALPAREGAIIVNDPGRTFSRDSMKGF